MVAWLDKLPQADFACPLLPCAPACHTQRVLLYLSSPPLPGQMFHQSGPRKAVPSDECPGAAQLLYLVWRREIRAPYSLSSSIFGETYQVNVIVFRHWYFVDGSLGFVVMTENLVRCGAVCR
mmetsp:Transcript_59620/g.105949  ORF Transcript_59620/g.105949 Transcript_59620/m.105949 type:complete len:122 (+) Transcript_59620:759-1124(+)